MMDTMGIVIPTSLYVYERVKSVKRLKSMLLEYSVQSKSHDLADLYVSTEMKITLSWYMHLKINFLSLTDSQVRKYFSYAVCQRPRDFIVNNSDVDDDKLVSDAVEGLIVCRKYPRFL